MSRRAGYDSIDGPGVVVLATARPQDEVNRRGQKQCSMVPSMHQITPLRFAAGLRNAAN